MESASTTARCAVHLVPPRPVDRRVRAHGHERPWGLGGQRPVGVVDLTGRRVEVVVAGREERRVRDRGDLAGQRQQPALVETRPPTTTTATPPSCQVTALASSPLHAARRWPRDRHRHVLAVCVTGRADDDVVLLGRQHRHDRVAEVGVDAAELESWA